MSGFPSELLHAAWLRGLGQQDSPDSAVDGSQHRPREDIWQTESGQRRLRTGAVPATAMVCMICLDTDSKMVLMRNHNLGQTYEKLTGYPLCDGGDLLQTLCVQCAHRLRNFSRFREQSLRARSLMKELLEKHELITIQHIKMLEHENNQLRNNLVSTTLGPDPCDLYIIEHSDEDRQTDSEETALAVAIKTECSEDSQSEDEVMREIKEENSNADCLNEEFDVDPLKCQSAVFMCTVCGEKFSDELSYSAHAYMHLHGDAHLAAPWAQTMVTQWSARLATNTGEEARATEEADISQNSEQALVTNSRALYNLASNSGNSTNTLIKGCVVKLYDILKYPQSAKVKIELSTQTLRAVSSCDSLNALTACKDIQYRAASEDEASTTNNGPAASLLSVTEPSTSGRRTLTCDVCQHVFKQNGHLVVHMRTHTGEKPYSCKLCSYKCTKKSDLNRHMWTHTGEKPYSCKLCSYKCTKKCDLNRHMRTHTGEKPYSCKLCSYKFRESGNLAKHMRTHTGEKPYSCKLCNYKCRESGNLTKHMRTHTSEKPYFCKVCGHKFTSKGGLVDHIRTHAGEKPFSCEICEYKCAQKGYLAIHMRIHTGEKPFSCKLCSYKCRESGNLAKHMKTHR